MDEKPSYEVLEKRIKDLEKSREKLKIANQELICERNKQAAAVRFFKNLLDLAPNFFSYVDKNHTYRYVNRRYLDFFEKELDAIVGMPVRKILGEEGYKGTVKDIEEALKGRVQKNDTPIKKPDGQLAYLTANFVPRFVDNDVEGILVVVEDNTERIKAEIDLRESETRFRRLVENSLVGISMFWEGRHIYRNPEYLRIFGDIPDGEYFPFFRNIHAEDVRRVKHDYNEFVCGNIKIFEAEFRIYPFLKKQFPRKTKWIQSRAIRVRYEDGQAIMVTVMDTTRIKELEVLVGVKDKMGSLGRVATGIAHELRNPVSAINVYLAVMQETIQGLTVQDQIKIETIRKVCHQMREASDRIDIIVRKVMDFAKPSTPKLVASDLNHSIQKSIDLSDSTLKKNSISLSTDLDQNLPKCMVDPHLIEQVLLNLLSNAIQVLKDHGGARKLEISSQKNNSSITICVADSGPGISEHIGDKIFDPFYTTSAEGSGIGLSMSRRILSDHHGRISVSKSKWGGAEFEIQLPRPEQADDDDQRLLNSLEA